MLETTRARSSPPTFVVTFPALRRFLLRFAVLTVLLGVPTAVVTYGVSARGERVYADQAVVVAPVRGVQLDPLLDVPPAGGIVMPDAYRTVLSDAGVLADAWRRASPEAGEPTDADLLELAGALSMSFQERRTSFLMFVSATGGSSGEATRRANAIADALVAWDDERVRQEMTKVLRSLESQLAALQEQLAQLQALGSRANLPQMASISVLSNELRRDIAMARADAVSARGNLEVIEPAARGSQVAPSPLVDAVIAFALVAAVVLAVGLLRAATTRRIRGAESLAEAAGTPLLVDLTRPSGRPGQRRRGTTEMQFLKAHLDRTLAPGASVLVAGLDRAAAADHVAAELDRLYAQAGSVTSVQVGAALLSSGEAIERAARADAVVVVAEPRSTDRVELQQVMAWLRRARANVVGLVATGEKAASRSAPRRAVGRAL